MTIYRYGVPKRDEPPVEITWEDNFHTLVMRYNNQEVTKVDAQSLAGWQTFALPNGASVDLKLPDTRKISSLQVYKNNQKLVRLDSGSFFWIRLAVSALRIWGVLQLVGGGFRLALSWTDLSGTLLIVGAIAFGLGIFCLVAARYVQQLSIRMTLAAMLFQLIHLLPLILSDARERNDPAVVVPLVIAGIVVLLLIPALFAIRSIKS